MQAAYLPEEENYHQLSQLILLQNPPNPDIPLYSEISEIMKWIESSSNRPLLITSKQFGGKKVLISELTRHLKEKCLKRINSKNDDATLSTNTIPQYIAISQFSSVTPYFSDVLYKVMSKLRVFLGIQQKVQLNEEKLRQYFRYWLEIADDKVEKQFLGYHESEKPKVIIIIEAVDKVVDGKQQPVIPSFWLPDITLKNIKIILTAETSTPILDSLVGTKIQHVLSHKKISQAKEIIFKKCPLLLKIFPFQQKNPISYSDLKLTMQIMKANPTFEKQLISSEETFKDFQNFLIKFIKFVSRPANEEEVKAILGCLIWNKKGLTRNTIRRAAKIALQDLNKYVNAFKPFILEFKDSLLIMNGRVKLIVSDYIQGKSTRNKRGSRQQRAEINLDDNPSKSEHKIKKQIHLAITKALQKESATVNNLEESIHHLRGCGDFTELKQILSRIENFLVLYTPLTKHLLCVCWLQLENQFQYDPVFEYNKAIERFLNHYYPSPEDTFKIIFQLSLFFKEYSEFENFKTPEFRHPPIRGEVEQMREISIFEQLLRMGMFQKSKQRGRKDPASPGSPKQSTHLDSPNKSSQTSHKNISVNSPGPKLNSMKPIQPNSPTAKTSKTIRISQTEQFAELNPDQTAKEVQKLNVGIKFHQEKFRDLYMEEMQPYINEYYMLQKKYLMNKKDQLLDEDSDDENNDLDENKIDIEKEKIKKQLLLKKYSDYCEQVYHQKSQKRSFYYYKQWIWMQFPWICQSLKNDYSKLIEECLKSPTEYMSIQKQSKLILEALKIATMAKSNKDQIYQSAKIEFHSIEATIKKKKQRELQIQRRREMQQETSEPYSKKSNLKTEKVVKTTVDSGVTERSASKTKQFNRKKLLQDSSLLDGEIEKNRSLMMKRKGKSFQNHAYNEDQSSIFMTDGAGMVRSRISDKENLQNQSMVSAYNQGKLPAIAKSSTLTSTRLKMKTKDITEVREFKLLLTKLDEMKFQNKKLIESIELLKRNNPNINVKKIKKEDALADIKDIKAKIENKIKGYQNQKALKHKLETIIKLCDVNKSHGSQSQHLNNFLTSLKFMYKLETENMENTNKDMKRVIEECKANHKKLKEQRNNLLGKLRKEKQKLKSKLETTQRSIIKDSDRSVKKPAQKESSSLKKIKGIQKGVSYKVKNGQCARKQKLQKELEGVKKIENFLEEVFGIKKWEVTVESNGSSILDEVQGKVDKLNEISWQLSELKEENIAKAIEVQQLKSQLNILQSNQTHESDQRKRTADEQITLSISRGQQRKRCLMQCMSILQQQNSTSNEVTAAS